MGQNSLSRPPDIRVQRLQACLDISRFRGDFEDSLGARLVASTDNSIYEIVPAAIAYPYDATDVVRLVEATGAEKEAPLSLTARGGNTGTNGQSLNSGVVVDFARHMNRILSIDSEARLVTVEPGVVLDQLNDALSEDGLFFPPNVSTASRATIGGMVATDASGKGSRIYGKTSDYIESMDLVLADGTTWTARDLEAGETAAILARQDRIASIHSEVLRVATNHQAEIQARFPDMNRGLTGYNLQKAYDGKRRRLSLPRLLAGSEGTLAITTAVTLRVVPKPTHRALVVIRYDDFSAGLRDVSRLLRANPLAVEILDDKVLGVAQQDIIWAGIEAILGTRSERDVRAMSFVEFTGFTEQEITDQLRGLDEIRAGQPQALMDCFEVREAPSIAQLWAMREKAVGLLAKLGSSKQGVPFVEDTAVPPSRLADYVEEFRALLDRQRLQYGMFGHADVGCLHVRPFLDMKSESDAALIRTISDEVAALTKRYGGLLWGEHGRGFRGEYSPMFFGPELYRELVQLKRAFDPENLLNPGKLASAKSEQPVERIDGVPFRGNRDRAISSDQLSQFDRSVACNGNGACFSWDSRDAMCPSYKATRDRAQSPKGRAALLRSWSRLVSLTDEKSGAERVELEDSVQASLATCLSCKACTTFCPVGVDIPTMKSRFLERYYQSRRRPTAHWVLSSLEVALAVGRRFPRLANLVGQGAAAKELMRQALGLIDMPRFSTSAIGIAPIASVAKLRRAATSEPSRPVVLVEDTFTASFDRSVIDAAAVFLTSLGYRVSRLPARPNGKALYVLGLRKRFEAIAQRRIAEFEALASSGAILVGLDAATSLLASQEYREFAPNDLDVVGLERFLASELGSGRLPARAAGDRGNYVLLSHCTEQALRPSAAAQWRAIFDHFGLELQPIKAGCCGMAGLFGHETRNVAMSRALFEMSWAPVFADHGRKVLATGYSCRSQSERIHNVRPPHPVEILAREVFGKSSDDR